MNTGSIKCIKKPNFSGIVDKKIEWLTKIVFIEKAYISDQQ
jgi:hypothetical protein